MSLLQSFTSAFSKTAETLPPTLTHISLSYVGLSVALTAGVAWTLSKGSQRAASLAEKDAKNSTGRVANLSSQIWAFLVATWAVRIYNVFNYTLPDASNAFAHLFFPAFTWLLGSTFLALRQHSFSAAVLNSSQRWWSMLQILRMVGILFNYSADEKNLPLIFAQFAGYGDAIVSIFALASWFLLDEYGGDNRDENAPEKSNNWKWLRWVVLTYNIVGVLDFVGAFATGIPNLPSFQKQLSDQGISTRYIDFFWMIPSYNVPLFCCIHILSIYKLINTWSK